MEPTGKLAGDGGRRRTGAALPLQQLLAVVVVVGLVWTAASCSQDPSVRSDLAARIARSDSGPDYTFTYEALGSSILDCTMPNRRFTGRADRYGISIFNDEGQPIAVTKDDRRYLHARLFAPGSTNATWIEVFDDDSLEKIIGSDLAVELPGSGGHLILGETLEEGGPDGSSSEVPARVPS